MARVQNLFGTKPVLPPNFTSWNHWWETKKGKKIEKCSNIVCNNEATVCTHVQRDDFANTSWLVVPLCEKCSTKRGYFYVNDIDMLEIKT